MRGKKCKAARRLARQLSAGMIDRQWLAKEHLETRKRAKSLQAVNNPRSTRGIYRQTKKLLRKGIPLSAIGYSEKETVA